jgi:hypothetical protein
MREPLADRVGDPRGRALLASRIVTGIAARIVSEPLRIAARLERGRTFQHVAAMRARPGFVGVRRRMHSIGVAHDRRVARREITRYFPRGLAVINICVA